MATLEQLEDALRSEAQAGNTENQQKLSDAMRQHPTFQANAREKLESQAYRYDDNFNELSKDEQRKNMSKQIARSMGLNDDEVDVTQGMGLKGRFTLSFQPTEQDKFKELEDRYGRENVQAIDIGGKSKLLYRDEQETGGKFRAVDEEGTSLADFFGDTAGTAAPIAGAIGAAVATGGASIPLAALAAAGGGFAASAGQDVVTRAVSDEDIRLGEIAKRRGIESGVGFGADIATGGLLRLASKGIASKMTGDASAQAFGKIAGDVPEGSLTPRMMQGDEQLTRELGIEGKLAGRPGDARQAIDAAARRRVGDPSTQSFEEFTRKATQEKEDLLRSVPEGNDKLAAQIENQYNEKLRRFGAGDGRVMSDIGDGIVNDSINPALVAARKKKNALYKAFDDEDAKVGGVFDAATLDKKFDGVIKANKGKNASAIKTIQNELKQDIKDGKVYSIGEVDDLISRVTDAMPDGVLKDKTAAQIAAQLADSLTTTVKNKAKKFPELNQAWKDANKYYKDTYTKFGRGGISGATKDASGETVLSGQGVIQSLLSDPRQIKNVLSIAKEGGQSPLVVKKQLKEAFLISKGIHKGENISKLSFSQDDRSIVKELWGNRGLKRLEGLSKSLNAKPGDLEAYLGALSPTQAQAARKTLEANAREAAKLDSFTKNSILRKMSAGDLPANNPSEISKAFLGAPPSMRSKVIAKMKEENPQALADLKSIVGTETLNKNLFSSNFKNAIGEPMFDGRAVKRELNNNKAALEEILKGDYNKLVELADAQSRLAPLTKQEAEAKLRTTFGAQGISLFVVGDLLQAIKDKAVALAYRTKSLDKLSNGWSKANPKAIKSAIDQMVNGERAARAFAEMNDPDFEEDIREIDALIKSGGE